MRLFLMMLAFVVCCVAGVLVYSFIATEQRNHQAKMANTVVPKDAPLDQAPPPKEPKQADAPKQVREEKQVPEAKLPPVENPLKEQPSPEELARRQVAKELALAKRRTEVAATKLALAKAQVADGKRNLGNISGEKLIEYGIRRLEAVIDDYADTDAAAEAKVLLAETRQFLDEYRKSR